MGYITQYEVEMDKDAELVREYVNENHDENGCLTAVFNGWAYEMKWYGHEEDVREVSRQFPDVLITLTGEGEDNGDMWRKYFKGGKMQACHAKITFDDYDEKELR
ncbi:hypothetical protein [Bacillus amyloliquefaciens]|uniref:hypothetical protein n=1 Tax=Bacillus amyloliquefaciens TaxID=1390 RepID=UPI0011CAE9AE|nr:hypothetical protein [Bacillus amyloliquefaciens]TXK69930.1 hypothetical protein FVD39_04520 [Bacillus amyloliquefaciens]